MENKIKTKVIVKWDSDKDCAYLTREGDIIEWPDIDHFDLDAYRYGNGFDKDIERVEKALDVVLEWEDIKDAYWHNASECIESICDILYDYDIDAVPDPEDVVSKPDYSDEIEKIKKRFNDNYYLIFEKNKGKIKEILEKSWEEMDELETTLYCNRNTGGRASIALLAEDGLLVQLLEDSDNEEVKDAVKRTIEAMTVAHNRHAHTNYDLEDKRGLTEDQVNVLRSQYNKYI